MSDHEGQIETINFILIDTSFDIKVYFGVTVV